MTNSQTYVTAFKKKDRKRAYFDSADFFMNGQQNEPHPNLLTNKVVNIQSNSIAIAMKSPERVISSTPEKTVVSNAFKKTRKYFDSADWMTNGNILPHHKYKA